MKPPRNLKKYLAGKLPLPAGFVPLAQIDNRLIGVDPSGDWMNYYVKSKESRYPIGQEAYQKHAMALVVATLGGTSAKAAKAIGVSPRTVESWRCGRKRLTVEKALVIARAMAEA